MGRCAGLRAGAYVGLAGASTGIAHTASARVPAEGAGPDAGGLKQVSGRGPEIAEADRQATCRGG